MTDLQVADPQVSRAKFAREVEDFRSLARDYGGRGWFLAEAAFPVVRVVMAAPQLSPPAIVTGVRLDYTNYDARPPSVRLVDPFTDEPFTAGELPTVLKRTVNNTSIQLQGVALPPGAGAMFVEQQPLMQAYGPDDIPFLCVAGVREYHDHPGHSGDAWELHRPTGAGRLVRILDVISRYGVEPITDYNLALKPEVQGFRQGEPPA